MVKRDDIRIHLGGDVVFNGDRWPCFVHTVEHRDGLVLVDRVPGEELRSSPGG